MVGAMQEARRLSSVASAGVSATLRVSEQQPHEGGLGKASGPGRPATGRSRLFVDARRDGRLGNV